MRAELESVTAERGLEVVDVLSASTARRAPVRGFAGTPENDAAARQPGSFGSKVQILPVPGDPESTRIEVRFAWYEELLGEDCTVLLVNANGSVVGEALFNAAGETEVRTIELPSEVALGGDITIVLSRGRDTRRRAEAWPLWHWYDGEELLARFVSTKGLEGLNLTPGAGRPNDLSIDSAEVDREFAERLFDRLARERIDYALEPYNPTSREGQIVREPLAVLLDRWATCVDLAVLYASMCLAAQISPMIALTESHALVVLVPGSYISRPAEAEAGITLPGCDALRPGILRVSNGGEFNQLLDTQYVLAVDVVSATRVDANYADALSHGDGLMTPGTLLIDVPYLHNQSATGPFTPTGHRETIRRYPVRQSDVPALSAPQRGLKEALAGADGLNVIYAPSGMGKSTLARELASEAPAGAAWFLDASSGQALKNSLASAEQAARNDSMEGVDEADRGGWAAAALDRLRRSESPWTVVLDNANGAPESLAGSMPPLGRGRRVLVTTTNPAWQAATDARWHQLLPVSDAEAQHKIGPRLGALAGGRPLLVEGFATLLDRSGISRKQVEEREPTTADRVDDALRGPLTLWRALRSYGEAGGSALREEVVNGAELAARLPPDHIPLDAVARLASPDGRVELAELVELGLITTGSDGVNGAMHRLFREAIYQDLHDEARVTSAVSLVNDLETRRAYDMYADSSVIAPLVQDLQRLDAPDGARSAPSIAIGRPLHALAATLELRGNVSGSAALYRLALRHLDVRTPEASEMRADCLHGLARDINQRAARVDAAVLTEGVDYAREAYRLRAAMEGAPRAGKHRAMEGLLLQKLARYAASGPDRLAALEHARDVLVEAHELRRESLAPDDLELARSQYNLAGINIDLSKESAPDAVGAFLTDAETVYREVGERRAAIYRDCLAHPHIAACINGEGIVNYERARRLPATATRRTAWLRIATERTTEALRQRSILDGPDDLLDATKSSDLLGKIALARSLSPVQPCAAYRETLKAWTNELLEAGIVLSAVPRLTSDADLRRWIESWIRSSAVKMLVTEFGGDHQGEDDLRRELERLDAFSERWDYRKGKERNQAAEPRFTPGRSLLIERVADVLGLAEGGPLPSGSFDHVLVLGGLVRACLARPRFAAQLLAGGTIAARRVVALGAHRELGGDEFALAARLLTESDADEFSAMDAGTRSAFDLSDPESCDGASFDEVGRSWTVRRYRTSAGLPVDVVAAPSLTPGKRANTADTYQWLTSETGGVKPGDRVLVVTTHIYAYQGVDAIRMLGLPHGIQVEWVGMSAGQVDKQLTQTFKPHHYLQEVRSMIRALRDLESALDGTGAS